MKAVSAHVVVGVEAVGQGVDVCLRRDGGVEGRVEHRDLRGCRGGCAATRGCPAGSGGLWRGARWAHCSIFSITSGVSRAEALKWLPPCTTRWPTADTSDMSLQHPGLGSRGVTPRSVPEPRPWPGMGNSRLRFVSPVWVSMASILDSSSPMRLTRPLASTESLAVSRSWYLMEELPQLRTRTFMVVAPLAQRSLSGSASFESLGVHARHDGRRRPRRPRKPRARDR